VCWSVCVCVCVHVCTATRCLRARCRPAHSLLPSSSVGRWALKDVAWPSEQRQNVLELCRGFWTERDPSGACCYVAQRVYKQECVVEKVSVGQCWVRRRG
jgi:hypothetical protein